MIKQKGVCDVCTKEFELNGGSFGVKFTQSEADTTQRTVIEIFHSAKEAPTGYQHVCGKACLYRLVDGIIDRPIEVSHD
jgi:hypothetical protein